MNADGFIKAVLCGVIMAAVLVGAAGFGALARQNELLREQNDLLRVNSRCLGEQILKKELECNPQEQRHPHEPK
jgi:hypothetical protein